MGEASAKRLRGGEMDDVIFGGSGSRPARNLAEVALTVDNTAREAPFAFNDSATIEVARRIVRGAGSTFRINGREARARDVQLLFADAASGPHSGALVGQGRIGALIAAKPSERRAPARRGGRHRRALCAAPRGRAETARRRGQSGAARRCDRDAGGADRDAEETGPAGAALSPARRADPRTEARLLHVTLAARPRARPSASRPSCAPRNASLRPPRDEARPRARARPKPRPHCRRCVWPVGGRGRVATVGACERSARSGARAG